MGNGHWCIGELGNWLIGAVLVYGSRWLVGGWYIDGVGNWVTSGIWGAYLPSLYKVYGFRINNLR